MTDKPKDIATLYSRAHWQAARYRDFSASRTQVRGRFASRMVRQAAEIPPSQQEPPALAFVPQAVAEATPEERVTAQWYALRSVFSSVEAPRVGAERRPAIVALFSLAGGVGKTCLAATLGRALAGLGEHVLLSDTSACGLLPFYFGSSTSRPGAIRTFFPPAPVLGGEAGAPVKVVNLLPERYPVDAREFDPWLWELENSGRWANRILVDVSTGNQEVARRLLGLRPRVVVPVLPDMSSMASLGRLQAFLEPAEALYLLNQFDADSPLHLEVRAILQQQLGDRLLPFVVRRSYAISEALAEGMTVIDYAPDSAVAEDYRVLAGWLRSFAAPAAAGSSGVRWTEG